MGMVWVAAYGHADSQFKQISGPPTFVMEYDAWHDTANELEIQLEAWAADDDAEGEAASNEADSNTSDLLASLLKDCPMVRDQEWRAVLESWDGSRWAFVLQQDTRAE